MIELGYLRARALRGGMQGWRDLGFPVAIVPAPPDVEEYLIAGFLRQSPVELVKCETVDLEVPANAEIILEGELVRLFLTGICTLR